MKRQEREKERIRKERNETEFKDCYINNKHNRKR
jgi:hypothetical protein